MSYEKKLLAMKGLLKESRSPAPVAKEETTLYRSEPIESWKEAGIEYCTNEYGAYYVKRDFFSFEHVHGNKPLGDILPLVRYAQRLFEGHPLTPIEESTIYFYDTETTGLKGAGVQIFLNGFIERGDFGYAVTQYLLASPGEEAALLHALPIQSGDTLITYNGKSFDLPQLEVRWTMNRKSLPPFPTVHQIDLLHGSKRLWKGQQDRYKLQDMEKLRLGFEREDDLPGHLAPIVYFDALKTKNANNLLRVFEHNLWDLVSLVALYRQTLEHLTGETSGNSAAVELNLAKWLKDLKFMPHSEQLYKTIMETYEQQDIPHAYYFLGLFYKRNGKAEDAVELLQTAATLLTGKEQLEAYLHAAKINEHQLKRFDEALKQIDHAKRILLSITGEMKREKLASYLQDIKKREERVNRKNISRESAGFDK
ncbi:ribonuclease H-like domain-containing protein [Chryseomicrobium palamuruense]|uniref:Ribonuclease H-like domain-containing protein n=1 Tax=Chryseomicrobium palamuruense TaxID=682973 RepID=A0ABV8UU61_9BACL